jgi:hypothetical protein
MDAGNMATYIWDRICMPDRKISVAIQTAVEPCRRENYAQCGKDTGVRRSTRKGHEILDENVAIKRKS